MPLKQMEFAYKNIHVVLCFIYYAHFIIFSLDYEDYMLNETKKPYI
jgi:hypothetical protein